MVREIRGIRGVFQGDFFMKRIAALVFFAIMLAVLSFAADHYTRGVGIYPGNPAEDFAPVLVSDTASYRNLAYLRPAYHSSSSDYNLTAQLVTDGIKETNLPRWLVTTLSTTGTANKIDREILVDHNGFSNVNLGGPEGWMQFELDGGDAPFQIDRIGLQARIRAASAPEFIFSPNPQQKSPQTSPGDWACVVRGSGDGQIWKELGQATGQIPPPPAPAMFGQTASLIRMSVPFSAVARNRFYRVSLKSTFQGNWYVSDVDFFNGSQPVEIGGPYNFTSAWMAEGKSEEWIYVDLGARCTFDRVSLFWIRRAAEGVIQVSEDAATWKDLLPLPAATGSIDELKLKSPAQGRYVRVLMKKSTSAEGYILSEMEIYGRGGQVAKPAAKPALAARKDGGFDLASSTWRLQRDSLVNADGATLSKARYRDADWIPATVPATVLSSYWNIGAIPDPNYGDNQLMISDSFFYADFWYRTEFVAPKLFAGRRVWLNFDGINWKAEAFMNGEKLGRIEGGFMRGLFDVTDRIHPNQKNAIAIRIEKNATPGSMKQKTLETAGLNGGALGADNPTYHSSIGWDWIPPVRGRNIGIWNDVYLTSSGPVTIENPFVNTALPLPDTSQADVRVEAVLKNTESKPVSGVLRGKFGDVTFEQSVSLDASSLKTIVIDPSTQPALRLKKPKLWWPNGYGDQDLYPVELKFETGGKISDSKSFQTGVRQFTYSEDGGTLRIWINGRRFIGRGGNWGFPETNLRYRAREYNAAVAYHKDMNFTMIRNWVGQTGDEEFFEACDKYGIVIWQDFWLANPVDGPEPNDNDLFLRNVKDMVQRIRNHPSVGLYCGRNEGDPPKPIDDGIRELLPELHPGLHYISNSAWGVVSGGGPYSVQTPKFYFKNRATPKLHSELGMPNIVTIDSLRQMMPEPARWPRALTWGLHDFNLNSNVRISELVKTMDKSYGGANNAEEWVTLAQFINYDGYRAIFEAQSKNRMGILLWMSHPAWPSFVWQTYDYYFDPTAAYFGSKKGSEPLHIQWNAATDNIEAVNYNAGNAPGLTAKAEILNLDGSVKWEKSAKVDSPEDSVATPIALEFPEGLSPIHFIRLKLTRGDSILSENFYLRSNTEGDFTAIHQIPKVKVEAMTKAERQDDRWLLKTNMYNPSAHPALMVRLKAVREKSGDRILPAIYSDNFISLMPGEQRSIQTQLEDADTRGEPPRIVVDGFNIVK
jgi:hypothetical protein